MVDQAPPATIVANKSLLQSKTFWASLITAVVPIVYPPAAAYIAANPELVMGGLATFFTGLRLISKGKVTIT